MKHLIKLILLFITVLIFSGVAQASYCYIGMGYYRLLIEEDGLALQETRKDSNEISYISQNKVTLQGVTNKGFKVIFDEGRNILFLSDNMYYLIPKSLYTVKEFAISPLFREDEVTKTVSDQFYLVSGRWYYVFSGRRGKNIKLEIPELKGNVEIIADFHLGEILLKDDYAVYLYEIGENKLNKIPNLTPSQTHLVQSVDFHSDHHYLYDDDTFYLTDIRFRYRDITKQFNLQGKHDGFTKAEIHTSYSADSMNTHDGLIWLYARNTLPQGEDAYFTPVQATYLNTYKDLYVYHDKVYATNRDLIQEYRPLDLSVVQHPDELHQLRSVVFTDNETEYLFDDNQLKPQLKVPSLKRTNDYIEIQENRIFIGEKELSTDVFKGPPLFLGSIVNVVKGCDSMAYLSPVIVNYYYFFKDDENVYSYLENGNGKLTVLETISAQDSKIDDYPTLQKLMHMLIDRRTD